MYNSPFKYMSFLELISTSYKCYVVDLKEVMNVDSVVYVVTTDVTDDSAPYIVDGDSMTCKVFVLGKGMSEELALEAAQDCLDCDNEREYYLDCEFEGA